MEVVNNGGEVDMSMAENVSPERGREGRCSALGNEALVGSLGVVVVDISEYVRFFSDAEVVCVDPGGPSTVKLPIPCIQGVVIVRDLSEPFKGASGVVSLVIPGSSCSPAKGGI